MEEGWAVVKDEQGDEGWETCPFIAFLSWTENQRTINTTNITKYSSFTERPASTWPSLASLPVKALPADQFPYLNTSFFILRNADAR